MEILLIISNLLGAILEPLAAILVLCTLCMLPLTAVFSFVESCREKPERGRALAEFVRSWLT